MPERVNANYCPEVKSEATDGWIFLLNKTCVKWVAAQCDMCKKGASEKNEEAKPEDLFEQR